MKQPQTSLEAYDKMKPKIPTDQEVILSVLREDKSFTYHEIASRVKRSLFRSPLKGFDYVAWGNPNKTSRRLKELVLANKIEVCEPRICSIAKSNCKTYKLIKQ